MRDDGIIKVSRSLKEVSNKVRIAKDKLTKEFGREPSINEVAQHLDISVEEMVMAMESMHAPESLFNTFGDDDGSSSSMLIDRIDDTKADSETDLVDRIALKQLIDTLGPRERQIIFLRYFQEKTQYRLPEMLGISQVRVSRIEEDSE